MSPQALVAEILWSESNDDFLHFLQNVVKRYDANITPLVYLANIVEVRRGTVGRRGGVTMRMLRS
jgi:hypothetical protein